MGIPTAVSLPGGAPVDEDVKAMKLDEPDRDEPPGSSRSRREFLRISGLAVGAAGISPAATGPAETIETSSSQAGSRPGPDAVLARLIEGNKRFMKGELTHPGRKPEDFAPLAEG